LACLAEGYPALDSKEVEIAWMKLPTRDDSKPHYHRQSTEVTIVLSGRLNLIVGQDQKIELREGEFLIIPPGIMLQNPKNEAGTEVIVVKFPSVPEDKFFVD
jgi:quercetin dioxygenase-like cupin family protein